MIQTIDSTKVLIQVFNFEENNWIHLMTQKRHELSSNLFLLSLHGNIFLLSHEMENYQFSANNYTLKQIDPWIDEKVLMKAEQLSVIALNNVPKHLKGSEEETN